MKNIFLYLSLFVIFASGSVAFAATAATLTLNGVGKTESQITIFGDPHSLVELHYGRYASKVSTLGSTDQNGYLTLTISTASYAIECDNTAYVLVNSQRSQTIPWTPPDKKVCETTATNSFSFSRNDVILTIGQGQTVTMNGSGGYTITNNSNPIISANVSGNTLSLYSSAFGGTNITVCDSSSKCAVLYVVAINAPQQCTPVPQPVLSCPVSPVTSTPAPQTSNYIFSLFLTLDSTGKEVTELQKRLTSLGFYSGPITGTFGPLTKAAVIKFQKEKGVDPVGYVGPGTRTKLNQY